MAKTKDVIITDGEFANTYIICDVPHYYDSNYGEDYFDVYIFDSANIDEWKQGNDAKYIKIKSNQIENIYTADGYKITSADLVTLAEQTASWLYYGNDMHSFFNDVQSMIGDSTSLSALISDMQQYAVDNNLWTSP